MSLMIDTRRGPVSGIVNVENEVRIKQEKVGDAVRLDSDAAVVLEIVNSINTIVIDFLRSQGQRLDHIRDPYNLQGYYGLSRLLDEHPLIVIVPNELNKATNGLILVGRKISIEEVQTVTAITESSKAIGLASAQKTSEIPLCGISENACSALDRVIARAGGIAPRRVAHLQLPSSQRVFPHQPHYSQDTTSDAACCLCTLF